MGLWLVAAQFCLAGGVVSNSSILAWILHSATKLERTWKVPEIMMHPISRGLCNQHRATLALGPQETDQGQLEMMPALSVLSLLWLWCIIYNLLAEVPTGWFWCVWEKRKGGENRVLLHLQWDFTLLPVAEEQVLNKYIKGQLLFCAMQYLLRKRKLSWTLLECYAGLQCISFCTYIHTIS